MEGTARKKTKPGMSKDYVATQSYRNTLDSNRYLIYDILRIIFQYLNARDLGSAAMVCRSWSEAANDEKSTRGPCCFIIDPNARAAYKFLYKMRNIRIKPSTGFFVIPSTFDGPYYNVFKHYLEDHTDELLPKHCKAIKLCSIAPWRGIQSLVCAFLPQIPNVRIKSFKLAEHCVIQESAEYKEIISTIVDHETCISNHETSTCFMLFYYNYKDHAAAIRWASAMQESKEVKIASVCGGIVNKIYVQHKRKIELFSKKDAPEFFAVLITGSIQTWSTILDKCDTEKQVEARLKLFKDEVKLKKHSIGFMFTSRCKHISYETKMYNTETTIFKRLFPKVALLHYHTLGVLFGKTTNIDKVKEEKNDEEAHECKTWTNKNSTIFLILTYG